MNKTYKLSYLGDKVKELLNKIDILTKKDVGLDQVDNTSDANKPISILQQKAINEVLIAAKQYTDNEIAEFDFIKIVNELPATGLPNRIYLVPKINPDNTDLFDEYLWINDNWEWITTKEVSVDLTNYYTNSEIDLKLNEYVKKDGDKVLSDNNYTTEEKEKLSKVSEDFIITLNGTTDDDGNVSITDASATFEEIKAAYDEGKNVKLLGLLDEIVEGVVPLIQVSDEVLLFSVTNSSTNITIICTIDNNWSGTIFKGISEARVTTAIDEGDPDIIPTSDAVVDYVTEKSEELKLRDERLKYYGDADIVPSDESLFTFTILNSKEAFVKASDTNLISGDVVIPYKCNIDGNEYLVTAIGDYAFSGCSYLTSIIIPDGVTSIGNVAFGGCFYLTSINIPDSVTSIGNEVFENCVNLTSITCAEGSVADRYAKTNGVNVEYTNEVTKQFVLDNGGKSKVITSVLDTLILEDRQDAQLGEIASLILSMPDNVDATYQSSFNFKSGDTATILTYTDTPIIWRGDDCDSDGDFIPEANTVYEVSIKNLGSNGIVARVGVV